MPARKTLRIVALGVGVVLLGLGAAAWSLWPEVEEIPEELEAIEAEVSIPDLELPAQGPMEAVRLGDLQGKKVVLLIEGRESMSGGEGKLIHRAMHRWQMPEDVVVYSVGDAPAGAVVMRSKIEREFVGPMRGEMRWPIYIDYGGALTTAFNLPKGHLGLVVLDEQGEVAMRHAGDLDEAALAELETLLGAKEPEPGPPAPAFSVGGLDDAGCRERDCVLVFLDRKVARGEIPGLEDGGFEGDMQESFEQIAKPSVRLARLLTADWGADERAKIGGVVIGEADGWEVEGWPLVAPDAEGAAEARAAFEMGEEAGMVVLANGGRVSMAERGLIPFWKMMLAADILGVEPKEYGEDEGEDEGG